MRNSTRPWTRRSQASPRHRLPESLSGYAAALIAGAPPAFAFPALSWWWLAWVGLVPLLFVVRAAPTAAQGAARAWAGMTGFVLVTQYWLWPSVGPLLIVLAVGLGGAPPPLWSAHPLARGRRGRRSAELVGSRRSGEIVGQTLRPLGAAG